MIGRTSPDIEPSTPPNAHPVGRIRYGNHTGYANVEPGILATHAAQRLLIISAPCMGAAYGSWQIACRRGVPEGGLHNFSVVKGGAWKREELRDASYALLDGTGRSFANKWRHAQAPHTKVDDVEAAVSELRRLRATYLERPAISTSRQRSRGFSRRCGGVFNHRRFGE
jgi:hypothetical protein